MQSKDMKFPYFFIHDQIDTDEWNNIPIPLVDAIITLKKGFTNTENILVQLIRENKQRSECTVKKIQMMEKQTLDREEAMKKQFNSDTRKNSATIDSHRSKALEENARINTSISGLK